MRERGEFSLPALRLTAESAARERTFSTAGFGTRRKSAASMSHIYMRKIGACFEFCRREK
jgi:hypothetical protein